MIKVVDSLDLMWKNNQPLGCCIYNRVWQKVALKQGDMDGACAVYSLMMYLISLRVLTYAQVTNLNTKFREQNRSACIMVVKSRIIPIGIPS